MSRAAVFFDRDGVLCTEAGYVTHPSRLRLAPGAADAVRAVRGAGMLAIVVTNQSGVARGLISPTVLAETHRRLGRLLADADALLDGIYACPHHPTDGAPPFRRTCACRKPRPGLIERAAREHGIDLAASVVVGDRWRDLEAGRAARVGAAVLVRTGYGRGELLAAAGSSARWPDHVANDVAAAARWIVARAARGGRPGADDGEPG